VNREALQLGEITLSVLDEAGKDELQAILEQHLDLTGSPLAKIILDDFSTYAKEFVRVMPRDYARIVEIQQDAQATGIDLDGEEVWTQILEVTNG
jgi:glutamate synthase (NADPH/NADH) large chain